MAIAKPAYPSALSCRTTLNPCMRNFCRILRISRFLLRVFLRLVTNTSAHLITDFSGDWNPPQRPRRRENQKYSDPTPNLLHLILESSSEWLLFTIWGKWPWSCEYTSCWHLQRLFPQSMKSLRIFKPSKQIFSPTRAPCYKMVSHKRTMIPIFAASTISFHLIWRTDNQNFLNLIFLFNFFFICLKLII